MKKIVYLCAVVMACITFFGIMSFPVSAASFQQAYIRLDRQKANTSTAGTICVKPAGTGTESSTTITFPASFTINSSTAAWTVSTAGIPADSTAWPGINTASGVTGQSVTFPSSDLLTGTLYCFRFTNANALTNPTAADNYNGTITSANASSTPIDSSTYALSVVANDQVTVTASVLPSSSDLDFSMTSAPVSSTTLHEDNQVIFTVSYQSNYTTTTPLTIEASWDKGTVAGSGTQIDIFDYDIGSASTSDDGTVPVVDLVNRTITWDIAALSPSTTPHTVTFSVTVRSSIPTQNQVTANTQAIASVDSAQLHQETIAFTIQATPVQPTATSTPASTTQGPSATPAPPSAATTTPSTTPAPSPSVTHTIETVQMTEVTNTGTMLIVTTSTPSTYVLTYGTDPKHLTKRVTGLTPETIHRIELVDLQPDTQYYFSITTTGINGDTKTSDIFTFKTAQKNQPFMLSKETMNVTFQQIPLTDPLTESILMPVNVPFTIHLNTSQTAAVKEIFAKIQSRVLGITETKSPPPVEEVRLIELLPGVFSGDILTPQEEGAYSVLVTIHDIYGGIHTVNAPYRFIISPPITVLNETNGEGIEGANVIIQKYEENLKTYTPLPKGLSMDIRTDERGQLRVILPRGKYLIDVSSTGYQDKHLQFVIDEGTAKYPVISLTPDGSLSATVRYVTSAVIDTCTFLAGGAVNTLKSPRVRAAALVASEILLLGFSIILLRFRRRMNAPRNQKESFGQWLRDSLVIFLSDALMMASLTSLGFIIRYQGLAVSLPLILISLLLTGLWLTILRDLWIMQTHETPDRP